MRIQDNSIRLRLTRSEVDQVRHDGSVRAATDFPGGTRLDYALERSPTAAQPEASFSNGGIVVSIPASDLDQWASTEQVSIAASQRLEDENNLSILVEKDFACLAPREGEDESDMFPHPLQGQESC